jgi:AraC-like DNA-binding protein
MRSADFGVRNGQARRERGGNPDEPSRAYRIDSLGRIGSMTFRVQKMPKAPGNYFRYFALAPDVAAWGLGVTAAGFTHIPPGTPYPPGRHPNDHDFSWSRGRVLDAFQLVLISDGRGWFETQPTGERLVEAGTAFVLLPGVWHRYRPDPETGWEESWVELQGPTVNALIKSRVLAADQAVRSGVLEAGMETALDAGHERARVGPPGFDAERAAAAFAVLAAWDRAGRSQPVPDRTTRAVAEAERYLAEHHTEPVNIEALARRLGVAYSHFRRAFRKHTGFAPWQYVLHHRLTRARRLLASGDATLDAIADQLGFSSGFHLSTAFKQTFGLSPERWRRRLRRERHGSA